MTWYHPILAVVCFFTCMTIDYAHARYNLAIGQGLKWSAAHWSALQYLAGCAGFVIAVKVTIWFIPFEVAGLYAGTLLGASRAR